MKKAFKKIINLALFAVIAAGLMGAGYMIARAQGEMNIKYVPYIITEEQPNNAVTLPPSGDVNDIYELPGGPVEIYQSIPA